MEFMNEQQPLQWKFVSRVCPINDINYKRQSTSIEIQEEPEYFL